MPQESSATTHDLEHGPHVLVGPRARPPSGPAGPSPVLRLIAPLPPIGMPPDTEPLSMPSSTFETRRLVACGDARLELRRTPQERAFALVLAALGGGAIALGIERLADEAFGPAVWLPPLAGVAIIVAAALLWRSGGHVVLDGRAREFRRTGGALSSRARLAERAAFDDITAVQRLSCHFADEEACWVVHQINLVQRDGSRVHVCSHVEDSIARAGADRIARLIGVPVLSWPGPADRESGSRDDVIGARLTEPLAVGREAVGQVSSG